MRNQVYMALMKRRPQSTDGGVDKLGASARTKGIFIFQTEEQFLGGDGMGVLGILPMPSSVYT